MTAVSAFIPIRRRNPKNMKNYVKSALSKLSKLWQKIKNYRKGIILKLFLLLVPIAVSVTVVLFCCSGNRDNKDGNSPEYVAGSMEEIRANIAESLKTEEAEYQLVTNYIDLWGVDTFDQTKFAYFESCFINLYNYEAGMPGVETHAKNTVELYLENYYSEIDKTDVTAVTDALLGCYVDALDDPYSVYRPPVETDDYTADMSGKFGGIGVVIEYNDKDETIRVTTVYLDSPAEKAGVMVGDFIHAIDGVTVEEIGYRNAVYHVRGEIGTSVELTLIRNGEYVTVTATRAEVEETNVAHTFDEKTKIGYVQIVSFKGNTFDQFKKSVDALEELGAEGIIFDVRGNPGGYLYSVCDVVSYIVPTGKTVVTYQYKGKTVTELLSESDGYTLSESGETIQIDHTVDVPIVVLCDEYTASAGEIFTAALRDYADEGMLEVVIVGTNTFGKGIMQNTYTYTDESSVTFTVAYYNPPCGVNYHGVGVAPDVTATLPEPERDPETGDFLPVDDTQLDAAITELEKLINVK